MAALLNCDLCFRSIPNIYHSEAEHWHQEANQEDLFYEESYLLVNPIWVPEKWLLGTQSHSVLPPEHLKEFVGPRTLYGQQHKWVENNTKHGTWSTMTTWVTWIFFLFLLEFFFFSFLAYGLLCQGSNPSQLQATPQLWQCWILLPTMLGLGSNTGPGIAIVPQWELLTWIFTNLHHLALLGAWYCTNHITSIISLIPLNIPVIILR